MMYGVITNENTHILILTVVNVSTFFKLAFVTFLPFKLIVALYILPPTIVYTLFKYRQSIFRPEASVKRSVNRPYFLIWGIIPMLFSLFLITNFYFHSNSRVESYNYEPATDPNSGSVCELEGNKYEEYGGIRFVFSNDNFYKSKRITYTIATGYWGVDVLTDFSFARALTDPNDLLDSLKNHLEIQEIKKNP